MPRHSLPKASSLQASTLFEGAAGASFVGFETLGGLGYVPAASAITDELDLSVPPEVRAALKKLTKRDTTTKIKARVCMTFNSPHHHYYLLTR